MLKKEKISIVLGLVCLVLTLAIVIQIRTISSAITVSDSTYIDDELRDEVLRWKERYESTYKQLEESELELEKNRTKATENNGTSTEKEKELKLGEAILGTTEVSGKGIEIIVNDNQTVAKESQGTLEDASDYIVHENDLLNIVNELKNAGAEAISINDQRIVSKSSIICAGNIIRVNGQVVGAPFKIKAIGNQDDLYGAISRPGGYVTTFLDPWLIVDIKRPTSNITIVKYNGIMKPKYMKEAK